MKKYQIIYADPPWEYNSSDCLAKTSCLSKEFKDHYNYLSFEDLCNLKVESIVDDNCLLFMWVTSPKLNEAIPLGEKWGFQYATVAFVWDKKDPNPGYYTISQIEFCLVFRRGNIPQPRGIRNARQFVSQKKDKHSAKPVGIRNIIHEMFPTQNKIELFARPNPQLDLMGNNTFDDWDIWGNEVKSDIEL